MIYVSILIVLIIILTWYICRLYALSESFNAKKHVYKTPLLKYAHFSKIDRYNPILFPELLYNYCFELKKGDALFIPKGWWHWVESYGETLGVNFWLSHSDLETPTKITQYTKKNNWPVVDHLSLIEDIDLMYWDDKECTPACSSISNLRDSENTSKTYFISLNAFACGNANKIAIESALDGTIIPPLHAGSRNFWIALGYYDTGLHYDDWDGYLIVLSGKKKVRLFPPQRDLCSFPSQPTWAEYDTPWKFYPNEHTMEKCSLHLNQSVELYKSLYNTCSAKSVFTVIDNLYNRFGPGKIVWGLKSMCIDTTRSTCTNTNKLETRILEIQLTTRMHLTAQISLQCTDLSSIIIILQIQITITISWKMTTNVWNHFRVCAIA